MTGVRAPEVSVVIPIYNEEAALPALFARLYPALDALGRSYELVLVDDGSRDRSPALLHDQFDRRPDVTRVVYLLTNFGQHMAVLAGFERSRGERRCRVARFDSCRRSRNPRRSARAACRFPPAGSAGPRPWSPRRRRAASQAINRLRERLTRIRMTDHGCMLRAYSRSIVDTINRSSEVNTFVPALAYLYARKPTEIEVRHEERAAGASQYSLGRLIKLNFDLITGFSVRPLQIFSTIGMTVSIGSVVLYVAVLLYYLVHSGFREALAHLWDRDVLEFFLIGVVLFGMGLIGEYIVRIYEQVRARPRYLVAAVLEKRD